METEDYAFMVTPRRDATIKASHPSHDGQKARIYIGDDVVVWLYPELAERLKQAIDEAVAIWQREVMA